jgi:transposase
MSTVSRSSKRRPRKRAFLQKPRGQFTNRVDAVGPKHFGIVSVDCAKLSSKFMLADFYGTILIHPTPLPHTSAGLQAAIELIRQALRQHGLHDLVVAIERTGEYHRTVQRAFRDAGWDTRLVHPYAAKQFRLPANPGDKTDDHDLGGIHRATVNGFGLSELPLPDDYEQLQILIRHRRDLVNKVTALCNQIREHLHAVMPGYAGCFDDLWLSPIALPLARVTGSPAVVAKLGVQGLHDLVRQAGLRCHVSTLVKIQAWAETAAAGHPQTDFLRRILNTLDDDRLGKIQEISDLECLSASLLARLPYVLLLVIPGINVVNASDLAGELGPITHYANANAITGRAGLMPSRYQSDQVDRPNGPLRRAANRRLRGVLMQIASSLVSCNHHFSVHASKWTQAGKDPRWIRVKVAKSFSRIAYAMVAGRQLFPHPCCQQRSYILDKLLAFHRTHDTPWPQVLADLQAATDQLPRSAFAREAEPFAQRLEHMQATKRGPQPLAEIISIVLARLGIDAVQSGPSEDQDPS